MEELDKQNASNTVALEHKQNPCIFLKLYDPMEETVE